ncbi:DUF2161 family putative PD-(D/E)XK-type phosphodiesterase [Ahrensia kielensis]|uniref:DUF2161 family putative PD-(D/E)XK-type phosphodiesterase n=1 Tax=Ahrensia kielensis TaxID=76980 RepID=A0ABU9T1Z3_9HYPH
MAKTKIAETELYEPIKAFLSKQGYQVKSEIAGADIVAVREDEPPVIVEMKTAFSLTLYHQATDRQSMTDDVYIAVLRGSGRAFLNSLKNNKRLCRRLGIGLLTVRLKDGFVEPHLDPAPYKPRQSKRKVGRLLREFELRVGDPNQGGINKQTIVTAYRQDALRCLQYLSDNGPSKASNVAKAISVSRARAIMAADYYGWFERVERGIYSITPKGEAAKKDNDNE